MIVNENKKCTGKRNMSVVSHRHHREQAEILSIHLCFFICSKEFQEKNQILLNLNAFDQLFKVSSIFFLFFIFLFILFSSVLIKIIKEKLLKYFIKCTFSEKNLVILKKSKFCPIIKNFKCFNQNKMKIAIKIFPKCVTLILLM